jgi:hypothetical protein
MMNAAELNAMHNKARNCNHDVCEVTDNKFKCANCGLTGVLKWEQIIPSDMEFVDSAMGVELRNKKGE